jgi:hypothetical protein
MNQVKQVDGIILRINDRGVVVWCDDWSGLLRTALRGHTGLKLRPGGAVVWVG